MSYISKNHKNLWLVRAGCMQCSCSLVLHKNILVASLGYGGSRAIFDGCYIAYKKIKKNTQYTQLAKIANLKITILFGLQKFLENYAKVIRSKRKKQRLRWIKQAFMIQYCTKTSKNFAENWRNWLKYKEKYILKLFMFPKRYFTGSLMSQDPKKETLQLKMQLRNCH